MILWVIWYHNGDQIQMSRMSVPILPINLKKIGQQLWIEVIFFGNKHWAALDTGASRTVFSKTVIPLAYLQQLQDNTHSTTTLFSTSNSIETFIPELTIGELIIKDYTTLLVDFKSVNDYSSLNYPAISAIIGGDILAEYGLKSVTQTTCYF
jgi:hypothetical protein